MLGISNNSIIILNKLKVNLTNNIKQIGIICTCNEVRVLFHWAIVIVAYK